MGRQNTHNVALGNDALHAMLLIYDDDGTDMVLFKKPNGLVDSGVGQRAYDVAALLFQYPCDGHAVCPPSRYPPALFCRFLRRGLF